MSYYQPYYYGSRHNHRTHFDKPPCKYLYKSARQLLSWNFPFLAVTEPAARDRISSRWISSLKHLSRAAITCPPALWDNFFFFNILQPNVQCWSTVKWPFDFDGLWNVFNLRRQRISYWMLGNIDPEGDTFPNIYEENVYFLWRYFSSFWRWR